MGEMLLQAAGDDADMLGFGVGDLNVGNASWVLSRMAVEMRRMPARGESIEIYTWVSDYGRLFTTRNMVVLTGGVEIGAAVTQWAMIDLASRRPLDLSALSGRGASLVDRKPPIEMPRKVGECASPLARPHTVAYSDVDFNGHMGAMKYLERMVDLLEAGVAEGFGASGVSAGVRPLRLDINYIHEARLGDELTVCRGGSADSGWLFDIRNAAGVSICRAAINR
jgi:acyl-ACP thioesterase